METGTYFDAGIKVIRENNEPFDHIALVLKIRVEIVIGCFFLLCTVAGWSQDFDIYVSDAGNYENPPWQILKYDQNGSNPEVFIHENLAWPQDILFLENQNVVLISNLNSGRITKHDINTGEYLGDFATGIGGPTRMKIGPDNMLYVLQWTGNGRVKRYQLDGKDMGFFTAAPVPQSIGLDWDSEGSLYVSSYTQDYVRKFDTEGNDLGLFVQKDLLGPTNIWFDQGGDLLVSDYDGTAIKRFDSNGIYINDFITGLSKSEGIDFFPNGSIIIGNGATSSVKMFDEEGQYIKEFITPGLGGLKTPNAVVIREKVTSTGDRPNIRETDFIKPSLGNEFRIENTHSYCDIKVLNQLGQMVKHLPSGTLNFNTHDLTAGMYPVLTQLESGQRLVDQIFVVTSK